VVDVATNLRYLAWTRERDRDDWPDLVASWAGCEPRRAIALLEGFAPPPSPSELAGIAQGTDRTEEEIAFAELWREVGDIQTENIRYLLENLGETKQKDLAEAIGVPPATISDWKTGKPRPRAHNMQEFVGYLGLPPATDLSRELLFLDMFPRTHRGRVEWVQRRVAEMDPEVLREVFVALRRILEE
jgi:transcriptional regulator with XRE-family HTH domain